MRTMSIISRRCFVPLILGVFCGIILVGTVDFDPGWPWLKAHLPMENQPYVLAARWPQILTQMSAEFNRQLNCKDIREIRLLFVVMSTPNHNGVLLRELARKSFYKDLAGEITVKFVLGTMGLEENIISDLAKEQGKFGDLIMFNNHKETYNELPKKVQYVIQWANKYAQFDYLIKTDDDVVVLVDSMLNALKDLGCPKDLYWGCCFFRKEVVYKKGKWVDPTWYFCETYLPYCGGLGYVIGRQVVQAIAKYGNNYKHTRLEDATLGLWISPYRLTRKNDDKRFALEPSCSNDTILSHQSILNNFKKTTENLIKTGSMCTKKA